MAIKFNADEIFEIAEQMERNGARFYRKAAAGLSDERCQQILFELAAWEDEHLKTWKDMRRELKEDEKGTTVYDPDDEAKLYLRALAGGHVFNLARDPASELKGHESMLDVLKLAMGLEKDSVIFYLGMKEMVPDELGKNRVEKIIQQEMGHIGKLSREMAAFK